MSVERQRMELSRHPLWLQVPRAQASVQELDPTSRNEEDLKDLLIAQLDSLESYRRFRSPVVTERLLNQTAESLTDLQQVIANRDRTSDQAFEAILRAAQEDLAETMRRWSVPSVHLYSEVRDYVKQALNEVESEHIRRRQETQEALAEIERHRVADRLSSEELLDRIRNEGIAVRADWDTKVSELTGEVTAANRQVVILGETISRQQTRLDEAIRKQSEAFNIAESDRRKAFDNHVIEFGEMVNTQVQEYGKSFSDATRKAIATVDGLVTSMTEQEDQAKQLIGNIAAASTSKHYSEYAKNERVMAERLRLAAVVMLIIACAVTIWVFSSTDGFKDTGLTTVVLKAGITLPLIAAATYLVKESGKHRRQEMVAKDLELKMLALQPLISKVDDADQKRLLAEAARELLVVDRRLGGEEQNKK